MITLSTLWTYTLPSLVALIIFGAVISTSSPHGPGVHRAPHNRIERVITTEHPIETPGASLAEGGIGDVVRVPAELATLDRELSPEEWVERWTAAYRAEHTDPAPESRSDIEILAEVDHAIELMRQVRNDLITAILSPPVIELYVWRTDTDTIEISAIRLPDAPASLAHALIGS
jgi:hypothetical protein